jgi:hypothetical protein
VLRKCLMIGKAVRLGKKPNRKTVPALVTRWPEGPRAYNLTKAMEADREAWLALVKEQRAESDKQRRMEAVMAWLWDQWGSDRTGGSTKQLHSKNSAQFYVVRPIHAAPAIPACHKRPFAHIWPPNGQTAKNRAKPCPPSRSPLNLNLSPEKKPPWPNGFSNFLDAPASATKSCLGPVLIWHMTDWFSKTSQRHVVYLLTAEIPFFFTHVGEKRKASSILHNSGQTAVTIQRTACRRSPLSS